MKEEDPSDPLTEGSLPDWLREMDAIPDTLADHLRTPGVTPDEYIRAKHLGLGQKVLTKKRVYLDQNYWNYCRDVVRDKAQHPLHGDILHLLRDGVASGCLFCPASHLVLEETLKQKDPSSRELTAKVVQELSTGIGVQPFAVLDQAEILHFAVTTRPWRVNAYPPEQLVWSHIGNLFGHMSPVVKAFDEPTRAAIQKAWFDAMSCVTFPTLLKAMAEFPEESLRTPAEFYDWQNVQCEEHRTDFSSFDEVFLLEIAGGLDVYDTTLRDCLLYYYADLSKWRLGSQVECSNHSLHRG